MRAPRCRNIICSAVGNGQTGALPQALARLWAGRDFQHFLALNLCVLLSFLAYNCFAEIDRRLGGGGLRQLFFEPGRPRDA